jgi:alcohol dehydrogenase class IV
MGRTWNFFTAGQLLFGPGAVAELGVLAARRHCRRVLLVTDHNLIAAGIEARVREPLLAEGIDTLVFADGQAEPSLEVAQQAMDAAVQFRPDAILGLGGGSNMDLAKITAIVRTHGGSPADYFGFDQVPGPVLPLICVPTTSGTGSEVSHAAVLTDTAHAIKVSTVSNYLRPALAVVDPELTYRCPRQVTADSGIDALTHAIEAYTATDFSALELPGGQKCGYEGSYPLGDALAEQAIELIGRHLVTAVVEGDNHAARDGMSLAATLAGMAFSNCGVALVHALEYPLGGALHCSHGAGNGLLLPFVMRFNLPVRIEKFARIATLLGESTAGLTPPQAAELAIASVERLKRTIGIPERIRDLGGRREQLLELATKAHAITRLRWVNPRPYTVEQLVEVLETAF